jgi:hypothetical protein
MRFFDRPRPDRPRPGGRCGVTPKGSHPPTSPTPGLSAYVGDEKEQTAHPRAQGVGSVSPFTELGRNREATTTTQGPDALGSSDPVLRPD